jgi:hypothetical protein
MTHMLANGSTNLAFLGDCLALRLPWGQPTIYSIGDALLMLGMFFAIMELMGVSLRGRSVGRRPGQAGRG